jgi:hypothetical protein
MKQNTDNQKNVESLPNTPAKKPTNVELPLDLDDTIGIAIFDAVLNVKRRRLRSRSSSRRTK